MAAAVRNDPFGNRLTAGIGDSQETPGHEEKPASQASNPRGRTRHYSGRAGIKAARRVRELSAA